MSWTLHEGCCLEIMPTLPDKSIDLVITDPPYGKGAEKGTNGFGCARNRRYEEDVWDKDIPPVEAFREIIRVSQNAIIFGGNYFCHLLPPSNHWVVWDKKGDVRFDNPFADCELIYTTFNKPIKKITFKQQGFITNSKDVRYHPTQKPTELIQALIEAYTQKGDTILDCFAGSGTTAEAAERTGRNSILIEKEPKYCSIIRNRLSNLQIQQALI